MSKVERSEVDPPRLGAFGAPSTRVALAGLLFGSAPVLFSVARADDGGKFTANVQLGECRIAVVSTAEPTPDTSPQATESLAQASTRVNARFASPDTSGLTANVQEKQTEKLVLVVE